MTSFAQFFRLIYKSSELSIVHVEIMQWKAQKKWLNRHCWDCKWFQEEDGTQRSIYLFLDVNTKLFVSYSLIGDDRLSSPIPQRWNHFGSWRKNQKKTYEMPNQWRALATQNKRLWSLLFSVGMLDLQRCVYECKSVKFDLITIWGANLISRNCPTSTTCWNSTILDECMSFWQYLPFNYHFCATFKHRSFVKMP